MKVSTLLCIFIAVQGILAAESYFSVFRNENNNQYVVKQGKDPSSVAWAMYAPEALETGWDRFYITTSGLYDDEHQMFAAGFLEGFLTYESIWQSWGSWVNGTFTDGQVPSALTTWFINNNKWMRAQVSVNTQDPYWQQVGLVLNQLDGMIQGYNSIAPANQQMNVIQFMLLNADGDLGDLMNFIGDSDEFSLLKQRKVLDVPQYLYSSHCSALVKQSRDLKELFSAHTTWSGFDTMLRIYKIYNFQLNNAAALVSNVSFSSYPGTLLSIDDFYITSAGLSVIETTNDIFNTSLYNLVTPESLLSWVRTILANRMSTDGQTWTTVFAKYNSGTYNNQWIITDYKKFLPGERQMQSNTVWILEQIPGYCESADVSPVINQQGYWPSYNIPYFPYIYSISGYPAQVAKYGDAYSYTKCPRAQIFKRDFSKAGSLDGMKWIMRYNDYKNDPLSLGDPGNAISSRFDLETSGADPFGGIDSKIASYNMINKFTAIGISGPTFYQQTAFGWAAFEDTPHYGQPEVFNFDWHTFQMP